MRSRGRGETGFVAWTYATYDTLEQVLAPGYFTSFRRFAKTSWSLSSGRPTRGVNYSHVGGAGWPRPRRGRAMATAKTRAAPTTSAPRVSVPAGGSRISCARPTRSWRPAAVRRATAERPKLAPPFSPRSSKGRDPDQPPRRPPGAARPRARRPPGAVAVCGRQARRASAPAALTASESEAMRPIPLDRSGFLGSGDSRR